VFKYYSSYALVFGGFTHLVCCGIPLFLSFSSFFTNFIFFDSVTLDSYFLETAEIYLFGLTTLLFLMLISMEVYNKKIKCADDGCCAEQQCNSTKKKIKFNIALSAGLYIINSFIFLSEKIY
jgi:hypothetical protein